MVTKRPRQFNEIPRDFDPSRSAQPFPTRLTPVEEQPRPEYRPPQRNDDQNIDSFSESTYPLNDSSTDFPFPALSQVLSDNSVNYEHLRLEWSESDTKWEYIARYSRFQTGLWMASAPRRKDRNNILSFQLVLILCFDSRISFVGVTKLQSQCWNNRSNCC